MRRISHNRLETEKERIESVYSRRDPGDRYSWFNGAHLLLIQEVERRILRLLRQHRVQMLDEKRILEVGCGSGYWLCEFVKWGVRPENLVGIDILPIRVAEARRLSPRGVTVLCGSAAELELPSATFDLVLQATVFTSILDSIVRRQIASEMLRVVKADGFILWYDYLVNNPRNPDVRGVKKGEIHDLFPDCNIHLERITLAPPFARAIAPYSFLLCELLGKIPFLCTHYLGIIRKGGGH
jgi:SAM-dependent methyltransferase